MYSKKIPHMLPVGHVGNFPRCVWEDQTPLASVPPDYEDFLDHRILWGVVVECCYSSDFDKLGFYIQIFNLENEMDEDRVYPERRLIKVKKYQQYFLGLL